ncbi:MAG: hypothetical protein J7M21_05310 [Planctomycetes bacterium]|nr:hypothetical protein [Planctomycetota bacterium]
MLTCLVGGPGRWLYAAGAKRPPARPRRSNRLTIPDVPREKVICFALYTVQNGVLKLTAQLYPLKDGESRSVALQVRDGGQWKTVSTVKVNEESYGPPDPTARLWTANFRVGGWDSSRDRRYRVVALDGRASYEGTVRRDPVDKETIVVAAFTGNSSFDRRLKPDIIANIKAQDPDVLFFSGDQVYDHTRHLAAWLLFGRQFGEIIRDRPTICLPDDHDVGQGNLWGAEGKKASNGSGSDGGYFQPARYVNAVQYAQTWHLPDPYDPTPVKRGITVYYTQMTWGRVSFAIIEDRKWKPGPKGLVPKMGPRPDHITDPNYDPKSIDIPGAKLLGERQLKFLRHWAADWRSADMKCVLSQTVFAGTANIHAGRRVVADLDCDGWPQTARNRALAVMRKAFAFHICGDQHLATVVHYGIDDWRDAGVAFCVPSIVNFYPRIWAPLKKPANPIPGPLAMTGDYRDGLGNLVTMYAYANPRRFLRVLDQADSSASGYGLVRFNKKTRKITVECWPRFVDVTRPGAKQFAGWPLVFDQLDNYGRKAAAYLPTLEIAGRTNPVVQVVDEADGQVVYTLRINGTTFRPKVFHAGSYTIHVGQGARRKTLTHVRSLKPNQHETLSVSL